MNSLCFLCVRTLPRKLDGSTDICGQLVIHLEVLHLVRDVMHATPNTESENWDIDGAVLRVR